MIFRADMFQDSLNYTATIGMNCKCMRLSTEDVNDKANVLGRDSLDSFLHDMVAILIFDEFEDIYLQLLHKLSLLIDEDMFKGLKES